MLLSLIIIFWPSIPRFGAVTVALLSDPCRTWRCGQNLSVGPKLSSLLQSSGPRQDSTPCHLPSLGCARGSGGEQAVWALLEMWPLAHDKRKGPSGDHLRDSCLCCPFAPSKAACLLSAALLVPTDAHVVCASIGCSCPCLQQARTLLSVSSELQPWMCLRFLLCSQQVSSGRIPPGISWHFAVGAAGPGSPPSAASLLQLSSPGSDALFCCTAKRPSGIDAQQRESRVTGRGCIPYPDAQSVP